MNRRRVCVKLLLVLCCCMVCAVVYASPSTHINIAVDKGQALSVNTSKDVPVLRYATTLIPLLGVLAALSGIWFQIKARRKDDRLKNQLDRINDQISDFYGPLYSWYETGHQNYYTFLRLYGPDLTFHNPHYANWATSVFLVTNTSMESIIVNKSDLVLGNKLPACLLQFCRWAATRKVYIQAQAKENFDNNEWLQVLDKVPHPEIEMQAYLTCSFQVLKEAQSNLLSGRRSYINEHEMIVEIDRRKVQYINRSKDPNTEENKTWAWWSQQASSKDVKARS